MKIQHFIKQIDRKIDISKILKIELCNFLISKKIRLRITYDEPEYEYETAIGVGIGFVAVPNMVIRPYSEIEIPFKSREEFNEELKQILIKMEIYKREVSEYQNKLKEKYKDCEDDLLDVEKFNQLKQ